MNAKIQKISNDIKKTKAKINELQMKLREMEKQKTEFENADIIDAVRGADISLADLAAILKRPDAVKNDTTTSGQLDPKSKHKSNEEEINENEL